MNVNAKKEVFCMYPETLASPPSRQSILHFEFGRDGLAEPHALKAFELGQRAIECAFEGCFVAEQAI